MRQLRWILVGALTIGAVGCVDDPQDPKTWIKKIGDPREGKDAINQLIRLKDAQAVEPLIAHYKKTKDSETLRALATFKDKRAVPVFVDALDFSEDSFDQAAAAASALGEIKDVGDVAAVEALVKAVQKPLPAKSRANVVRLESMKALTKIHADGGQAASKGKTVDALIKILETSADDQDFFLNQVAATSLGELADPKAVPALIRGLFMVGRGADIFQPCRTALLHIGTPAVKPLIDAHQHKFDKLEEDAKKYEFRPGVIEQKTALMLGDLRGKDAISVLVAELKKPQKGDNHLGALVALGLIGDPSTTKEIIAVVNDAKRDWKVRLSAVEALNNAGDPSALPTLLQVAKTGDVTKDGTKYPDLRIGAAIAYSRLGGAAEAAAFAPVAAAEKAVKAEFDEAAQRLELAKKCNKDVACYGAGLDDAVLAKQEKAAFMLSRMGKEAMPALVKKISTKEPIVRLAVLFAIQKINDKSSAEAKKALEAQIELDKTKPPIKALVDEMRATLAILNAKG